MGTMQVGRGRVVNCFQFSIFAVAVTTQAGLELDNEAL